MTDVRRIEELLEAVLRQLEAISATLAKNSDKRSPDPLSPEQWLEPEGRCAKCVAGRAGANYCDCALGRDLLRTETRSSRKGDHPA